MKILIGYDGSDCAEAALDDLSRAGLPSRAEAIVLSVAEVWLPPPPSSYEFLEGTAKVQIPDEPQYAKAKAKAESALAEAHQAQQRLQTNFPRWHVSAESAVGSPGWEIVARADEWKPALVVVGSHGRSALGRFVLGSVAQRVVTEARCSVRVARGRVEESDTPVRLIVGLDGSFGSETTVREVSRRSWPSNSEVRLIVASDPIPATIMGQVIPAITSVIDETNRADRIRIETILARAQGILRTSGLAVSTKVEEGDPKQVLIAAAEEFAADCIFVGSTGTSNRLERFVMGSVAASIVGRAHCSVEVVR